MKLLRSKLDQPSSPVVTSAADDRSTRERIDASLKHRDEALSPRSLRKLLSQLNDIIDPKVSEIEGGRRAKIFAKWYELSLPDVKMDVWLLMSEHFGPDAKKVMAAKEEYTQAFGTQEEGAAEIKLRRSLVSPRTRLFQRFAAFDGGLRFLLNLRSELLPHLKTNKRLVALDAELENLFSTWLDVAFLELKRLSWDSPASLIEKLIQYEAVHDIRSWADLKNRLDSDRRCYGFFHPNLPNEPLIFVEVALLSEMADSIPPLLDENAAPENLQKASVAIFYSISNTQTGLRGVGFGDSLIKRVVQVLKEEFPKLKTFATLSPIPGFRGWATKNMDQLINRVGDKEGKAIQKSLGLSELNANDVIKAIDGLENLSKNAVIQSFLKQVAAVYLGQSLVEGHPVDAVAKFHLHNGARVERINWNADPSVKGMKQSWGIMVNYLYDLRKLDRHRMLLAKGKITVSSEVEDLFLPPQSEPTS
jgi:malonyl-CoA decarboxylase